jgi:hypothetical protein
VRIKHNVSHFHLQKWTGSFTDMYMSADYNTMYLLKNEIMSGSYHERFNGFDFSALYEYNEGCDVSFCVTLSFRL